MVSDPPLDRSRNPLLIGLLAIVGIGALVGLAFLVSSLVASRGEDLDLAWLPPDSEGIVRIRVAELWEAPLLQPATRSLAFFAGMAEAQYGLSIRDVESLTIGLSGISEAAGKLGDQADPQAFSQLAADRMIAVIRTSKALPVDKLTADGTRVQPKSGSPYYVFGEGEGGTALAAFFPDARTAVLGGQASVVAAMERGATAPDRPELAFADFDRHFLFILAPKDPSVLARSARAQAGGAPGGGLPPDLAEKVRAVSLGLTITEGLDLQVRANCADAESAERVRAELEQALSQARTAFGLVRAEAGPEHQESLNLVERMLNEARVVRTDKTVELAANLPRETRDVVARLAKDGDLNPFALGGAGGGMQPQPMQFGIQAEVPVAPEAMSVEEFSRAWQIDVDTQGRPAGDVLASLAESLRLELSSGPNVADALRKPVTLSLEGVSRFAAIEAVCDAAGIHPAYSAETGIALRPGRRSTPLAMAGPFVVDVAEFDLFPQYATGHLKLRLLTAGLPPSLMQALEKNEHDIFSAHSATGPAGQDLSNTGEGIGTFFQQHENKAVFTRAESLNLKDLLRNVETIAAVRGQVQLSLPVRIEELRVEQVAAGAKGGSGGFEVTVQNVNPGNESTIELRYTGAGYSDITIVPHDAAGQPLPVTGSYGGGSDTEGQITVTVRGRPASLVATAVTGREELTYEYELQNLPVPRAAERPERLPTLDFAGHPAPVSVESVGLHRGEHQTKARLRAVNHSNKDIRRLGLRLDYLGADGKKLDDWPADYTGEPSLAEDAPAIAVAKSGRAEFEVLAFFMPPDAQQVRARLVRVGFADGTTWEAPEQDE